ncbi:DUF998 domain-containing protein [Brevibacterium aurantiacum]|uniref:DUF998 domain-containing protein n=1 Tax=Brevibacterium aurantiacum TaxID=273384 RepID=A0A556CMG2_BREAU|nr:DUF998 domain-containing protein [Brevibacterium aurantiacum]TSI18612.1 DUF998 domain-containing protein [Brevibacterium aurantiacum]
MRETQSDAAASNRSTVTAAICWIFAGVVYLFAEAVTAAAFNHYSYSFNYISDLGVPDIEMLGNRPIDSPLHLVINVAFVIQGLLFATAALYAARSLKLPLRPGTISFACLHALGMVMIAVVNGGQHNNDLGLGWVHLLGAFFAFFGGHLTAICMGASLLLTRRSRRVGVFSVMIGAIGILGIVMLQVDVRALPGTLLPDGAWERIGMYAIVAWEMFIGAVLLGRQHRQSIPTGSPVGALG